MKLIYALFLVACFSVNAKLTDCNNSFRIKSSSDFNQKDLLLFAQKHQIDWQPKEGKLYLFNFWASWCAPCREELKMLDSLNQSQSIKVITVNIGDKAKDIQKIFKTLDIKTLPMNQVEQFSGLGNVSLIGLPMSLFNQDQENSLLIGELNLEELKDWQSCQKDNKGDLK